MKECDKIDRGIYPEVIEIYNLTKCVLCGNETELELSHIVPKMAVRTLKKTAIGNIRSTENPNKTR